MNTVSAIKEFLKLKTVTLVESRSENILEKSISIYNGDLKVLEITSNRVGWVHLFIYIFEVKISDLVYTVKKKQIDTEIFFIDKEFNDIEEIFNLLSEKLRTNQEFNRYNNTICGKIMESLHLSIVSSNAV